MVTAVKDNSCTLQKLSELKLRSKPYQLKLTEIYPVTPEVPLVEESLRYDSDEDEDVVSVVESSLQDNLAEGEGILTKSSTENTPLNTSMDNAVDHNTDPPLVNNIPNPSTNVLDYSNVAQDEDLDATIAYDDIESLSSPNVHSPAAPKPTRASTRRRDLPAWMKDGTYELKRR